MQHDDVLPGFPALCRKPCRAVRACPWGRRSRKGPPGIPPIETRSEKPEKTEPPGDPQHWRLKCAMAGGGALPDVGLYEQLRGQLLDRLQLAQADVPPRLNADTAWAEMSPAYAYEGNRLRLSRQEQGREQSSELQIEEGNQFARELDHFAQCVRDVKRLARRIRSR